MADKTINKIYHLADLHIRNLKRHKEYREVFNKFLKQVKKDNIEDSIIYIAGDIAHAKTEMSPELVQEISWFLTECSKLREVVLITGNHYCNLNNKYRLDVLTPIIENLNNPRIHYLRDTGIYPIHNLWIRCGILVRNSTLTYCIIYVETVFHRIISSQNLVTVISFAL